MKRQSSHTALKDADDTLSYILNITSEGVWDWTALNGHVTRSPGWYRMLGYKIDSFEKDVFTWENVIHPDDYPKVMEHFEAYVTGKVKTYRIEYRCKRSDGSYLWIEDKGKVVERTSEGKVARMIGAHLDINEIKIAQDELKTQNKLLQKDKAVLETLVNERTDELENLNIKLQEQLDYTNYIANHDKLTSLYNRYKFDESLEKEIQRAKRYAHPLSFIITDIDYFKNINDTYGHEIGDKVIVQSAKIIKDTIRSSDIAARYGGEEFIILVPQIGPAETLALADRIRSDIEKAAIKTDTGDMSYFTISIGVAHLQPEHDTTIEHIIQRADKALYTAKANNKNQVVETA